LSNEEKRMIMKILKKE